MTESDVSPARDLDQGMSNADTPRHGEISRFPRVKPAWPSDAPLVPTMRWRRFFNTYLQPRFLYNVAIRERDYVYAFSGSRERPPLPVWFNWQMTKLFWFWPRITDSLDWIRAAAEGPKDPSAFRDMQPDSYLLTDIVQLFSEPEHSVLDVGCNCGRHLNELHRAGYRDLHGVDASALAFERMAEWFPNLYRDVTLSHDLFQRFLQISPDNRYDVVMSHGATYESIHPSFDLVGHLCRTAKRHVIMLLNEYSPPYPRHWLPEFRRNGFELTMLLNPTSIAQSDKSRGARLMVLFVFSRCVSTEKQV